MDKSVVKMLMVLSTTMVLLIVEYKPKYSNCIVTVIRNLVIGYFYVCVVSHWAKLLNTTLCKASMITFLYRTLFLEKKVLANQTWFPFVLANQIWSLLFWKWTNKVVMLLYLTSDVLAYSGSPQSLFDRICSHRSLEFRIQL